MIAMKNDLPVLLLLFILLSSCSRDMDPGVRNETVNVYLNDGVTAVDRLQIPLEGGDGTIRVFSSLPLNVKYEEPVASADSGWFRIDTVEQTAADTWILRYKAASILDKKDITRRSGCLSLNDTLNFFGKFLDVHQGFEKVYDFAGDTLSLAPGEVYATEALNKLSNHSYDCVTFTAYALSPEQAADSLVVLDMTVKGGALMESIDMNAMSFSLPAASDFTAVNYRTVLLYNKGKYMPSATALILAASGNNPVGSTVRITDIRVYKVTEAEFRYGEDEDEWEDDVPEEELYY